MELKDIVYIDFKAIQNHAMLISEFTEVFEFKDNKPTKNVRGYKAEFGLQFKLVGLSLIEEE